jgi:acyl carrier protein
MKNVDKVREIIADALYLDKEEVTRDASLMKDLGAESIDFLDIIFRLEKEFSIKIPKGEIERRAKGNLSDAQFAVDGKLTDVALAQLKKSMPEVSPEKFAAGLMVRDIPALFTVTTFANMVDQQLFGTADFLDNVAVGDSKAGETRV